MKKISVSKVLTAVIFIAVSLPGYSFTYPWDNWIYHLDYKREEVFELHNQLIAQQDAVDDNIVTFNAALEQYQTMVIANQYLLLCSNSIVMDELSWQQYRVELSNVDMAGAPPAWLDTTRGVVDVLGGATLALRQIFKFRNYVNERLANNNLAENISNEAGEAVEVEAVELAEISAGVGVDAEAGAAEAITAEQVGVEVAVGEAGAVVEGVTLATLEAMTGPVIAIAFGIDVAIDLFESSNASHELDIAIEELSDGIAKLEHYSGELNARLTAINSGIAQEVLRFKTLVRALEQLTGEAAHFSYDFEVTPENFDIFYQSQLSALSQYGTLVDIRDTYSRALENNPDISLDNFIAAYMLIAPTGVTAADVRQYFQILSQFSTDIDNPVNQAYRWVGNDWTTIDINHMGENSVVFSAIPSYFDDNPGTVAIRNIGNDGFEAKFKNWNYLSGEHAPEEMAFVTIEAGIYTMADGTIVEVGTMDINDSGTVDSTVHAMSFATTFAAAPVMIVQAQARTALILMCRGYTTLRPLALTSVYTNRKV
ncbi:hypothetical protein [Thalassomonas sp. RHCl1]|uniref:hypothetical protein n=1 Tax=Thalassomonas sp. RHCl1 TaxID=2995320 RepID=UPI00248B2842|nr:hypothetical protein [Thalassomonas sp. RHCl1]